jgi:dTDP-4-dehydrorhamnose 3,5-epimerase
MKIIKTKFSGLFLIKNSVFLDSRGSLTELYKNTIIKKKFIFDYFTCSKKNTIRGLHFQINKQQEKYISILNGKIFDVCLDLRKKSKTFGKYFKVILSKNNGLSIFIPKGFAHGFCALENKSILHYKNTQFYKKNMQKGLSWNDKEININWPIKNPIISSKDKKNISLKNFIKIYKSL